MSDLNNIVTVTISRQTQAISIASFGTYALISEFATSKTTTAFDRHRYYASLTEMTDDGWLTTDKEYKAIAKALSQNPKVTQIMIGRIDALDATLDAGLTEVQSATQDWYVWSLIATAQGKIVYDADFVTSNSIAVSVNSTAITPVIFNADQSTTASDLKDQIESDITGATVTIDPLDATERTFLIDIDDASVSTLTSTVTLGASQAVATITFIIEDDIKAAAAWGETQKKIFTYASQEVAIYDDGSTTDIAYFMKNSAYDRTVSIFHTASQEGSDPAYIEAAWPGETLPYDPGTQTWAYKTLSGIATYNLTSAQKLAIFGKNCNTYTTIAGANITEEGKVASGEYIDVIRGIDWLEARLQEAVYSNLINLRKIPYTDEGIALIENAVKGVLAEGARVGLLISESIVVTVPKLADIPTADKLARNLPDVTFTANLQGAIHKVEINGTVTV